MTKFEAIILPSSQDNIKLTQSELKGNPKMPDSYSDVFQGFSIIMVNTSGCKALVLPMKCERTLELG